MDERQFQRALKRLRSGAMSQEEFDKTFGHRMRGAAGVPIIGQKKGPKELFFELMANINRLARELKAAGVGVGPEWPKHRGHIDPENHPGLGFITVTVDPRWMGLVPW